MTSTRLVVKAHRPFRGAAAFLVTLAILTAGGYAFGRFEHRDLVDERSRLTAESRALGAAKARVQERNLALRRQIASLEKSREVDRQAYAGIEAHLRELQDEILALKEEVSFYQGIVESNQGRGLDVHELVLDRLAGERSFRFQLVLTRNMKSDKVVTGTVSLSVAGEHGGQAREFTLEELSSEHSGTLEFQFKYFQRLEGRFQFPPGFVPRQVHVRVDAPHERPSSFERSFDWQELTG